MAKGSLILAINPPNMDCLLSVKCYNKLLRNLLTASILMEEVS